MSVDTSNSPPQAPLVEKGSVIDLRFRRYEENLRNLKLDITYSNGLILESNRDQGLLLLKINKMETDHKKESNAQALKIQNLEQRILTIENRKCRCVIL